MSDADVYDWLHDAEKNQDTAADVGAIPFIGQGMGAGYTAKARAGMGRAAEDIINDVDLPQFSGGGYGQYSLAGQYDPEMAKASTINEDPALRQTEMDALGKLAGNLDAASQTKGANARYAALDEGNQLARAREGAIRDTMERSGQSGSGMDALMEAQGAQLGANRARQGTMDAVQQQALERLANQQALQQTAGNIRGQDFNAKQANANIINQFGMFNTNAANEAKRMNLANQQAVGNANTEIGNKSLDRNDRLNQQMFGNAMNKATSRGNALQGMSNAAGQSQDQLAQGSAQNTKTAKDTIAGLYSMFTGDGE